MPHLRERLVEFCAHLIHGNLQSHSTTSASYVPLPLHDDERTEEFNRVPVASRRFAAATGGDDIAAEYSGNGNGIGTGSPSLAVQEKPRRKWFSYMRTKDFWAVMVLGQVLAISITSTNTFSGLLADKGASMPALQTFFNYVLLNIVYTSITIYRYGFRKWGKLLLKDGWRYFILAFMDVEGNYFMVLAYRFTTILSAQLINFWAIVVVVIISLGLLRVRYHFTQYLGILTCCGGMGILLASDHITRSDGGASLNALKGDLFALLGATFYGLTNCFEEFLASQRPMYEVIGQLGLWGTLISGAQAAIFDRASIWRSAAWDAQAGGYVAGYTAVLFLFYSLVPLILRLASAAFFNISLLTSNFWGVVIGVKVFHLRVHWMYPVAFVLIIVGCFVYFAAESVLGEAEKPWLGEHQEGGVAGLGTARRRVERGEVDVEAI